MSAFKSANTRWFVALVLVVALVAIGIFTLRKPQAAADESAAPAAANTGRVAFLMEQQWLIKMKLAKADEAELAPQIRSTARVVPVPANHAVVAPRGRHYSRWNAAAHRPAGESRSAAGDAHSDAHGS